MTSPSGTELFLKPRCSKGIGWVVTDNLIGEGANGTWKVELERSRAYFNGEIKNLNLTTYGYEKGGLIDEVIKQQKPIEMTADNVLPTIFKLDKQKRQQLAAYINDAQEVEFKGTGEFKGF